MLVFAVNVHPCCWPVGRQNYRHPSRQVDLMSTPPFSRTWPHVAREMADSIGAIIQHARMSWHADMRAIRVLRRRKFAWISDQFWRIGVGVSAVLAPAVVLALVGPS